MAPCRCLRDNLALGEFMIEGRSDKGLVDVEKLDGELHQRLDRKSAMALIGRLLQGEGDSRPNALWGLSGHVDLHSDRIGGPKPDPLDVAHGLLLGPARGDLSGSELADPGHLPQFFGTGLDDFEGRFAENADDPLCELGTNAACHAGAEVLLDAFGRRRWGGFQQIGLELKAMRSIREPDADGMDEFAGRRSKPRGRQQPRDRVFRAPHLQDREAVLFVVKRHPLDRADERFTSRTDRSSGFQHLMPLAGIEIYRFCTCPSIANPH
jgi:hypothetical protein